jgi:uncharacterized membrane protein
MSRQDRSPTVVGPGSNRESNSKTLGQRLHGFLVPVPKLGPPINPALLKRERERAERRQNRAADKITAFAGSILFVYLHVLWFACWIGFGVEGYPYGLLTMIVSLEAIFLSTFVMISQNRADAKRQVIADQQVAHRSGRGQAEQGATQTLEPDSRTDEGHPRHHDQTIGRPESPRMTHERRDVCDRSAARGGGEPKGNCVLGERAAR